MSDMLTILQGDWIDQLKPIRDGSVQMCVTSPPYWGLRSYLPAGHPLKGMELGCEKTPDEYVAKLVEGFREVWRVLRDDGTLWLNLGSSYWGGGGFCETAPSTQFSKSGKYGLAGALIKGRAHISSDGKQPNQSPSDVPACGSDGKEPQYSTATDSACSDLCDECRAALSRRNGCSAPRPQQSPSLPEPTVRDTWHSDCGEEAPGVSPLPVQESTTPQSSQPPQAGCRHCANCGACLSVLRSSSRDASLCARRVQCNSGILTPVSASRNQDKDALVKAYPYLSTQCLNFKPKDLVPIPWMVAMALRADGWFLRCDVIWSKPNPMPESVTDRPTKAHEYIFLLTKSERYFYDAEAIREEAVLGYRQTPDMFGQVRESAPNDSRTAVEARIPGKGIGGLRNKRTVWTVPSQAYSDFGYDFSGADYVDSHGIPHKWSPDCPVHERDGRPRKENHATVFCGGSADALPNGNERSDGDPFQEPPSSVYPIGDCKTPPPLDSPSCEHGRSIPESKIPGRTDGAGLGTPSHTNDTQGTTSPSMKDFDPPAYVTSATSSNSENCRTNLGGLDASIGTGDEPTLFRMSHNGSIGPARDGNKPSNKTSDGSQCCASPAGVSHTVHRSHNKSYNKAKCTCTISQVSHFATFPEDLIKPCILAGTSARGCCPKCGAPWERVVETTGATNERDRSNKCDFIPGVTQGGNASGIRTLSGATYKPQRCATGDWHPTCDCDCAETAPCTVLDPFGGSGTTGQVALELGRKAILIELNPEYIQLIEQRTDVTPGLPL